MLDFFDVLKAIFALHFLKYVKNRVTRYWTDIFFSLSLNQAKIATKGIKWLRQGFL